ncbi:hypothetical protein A1O1_03222 [Capronia coronata CBS 617.96]|uniref:FHA domain-containing protein n=1 Tax=Capronia coronata CBS 617.96 TaxID=1182541 RepID=W9ZJW8_9EURO|nr:uncharacterized protein A1O1_03222 [Capronia coronata CBS 617.96]EXJ94824.1 hypothetical protein A1O1_03222 [Capronia coronata CBS 617.96]
MIQDIGSMHGTHLDGRRLKTNVPETIWPGDVITLGADVTRGSSKFALTRSPFTKLQGAHVRVGNFKALQVAMDWEWSDGIAPSETPAIPPFPNMSRNSFSPGYSEAEYYEEECSKAYTHDKEDEPYYEEEQAQGDWEIEVVQDSIRETDVEIVIPPSRTFAVPDSDVSDQGSYISDAERSHMESPTSSPIGLSDHTEEKNKASLAAPIIEVESDSTNSSVHLHLTGHVPMSTTNISGKFELHNETSSMDVSDEDGCEDDEGTDRNDQGQHLDVTSPASQREQSRSGSIGSSDSPEARSNDSVSGAYSSEGARALNPSDAATVKPSAEPCNGPPFIQDIRLGAFADDTTPEESRSNYAWAGHNSFLYEPVPGNASNGAPSAPPATSETPVIPSSTFWPDDINDVWLPQFPAARNEKLPKVEVASVVDQFHRKGSADLGNNALKRKADQISSESTVQEKTAMPTLKSLEPEKPADTNNDLEIKLPTRSESDSRTSEDGQLQNAEMPQRKKVKRSQHKSTKSRASTGGSFVKFAAATVAGMAIGTVGTILGLASLPQDYFI